MITFPNSVYLRKLGNTFTHTLQDNQLTLQYGTLTKAPPRGLQGKVVTLPAGPAQYIGKVSLVTGLPRSAVAAAAGIIDVAIQDTYVVPILQKSLIEAICINGVAPGGELMGQYVWAMQDGKVTIVAEDSDSYFKAAEVSILGENPTIKTTELEVGCAYINQYGHVGIYLGSFYQNDITYATLHSGVTRQNVWGRQAVRRTIENIRPRVKKHAFVVTGYPPTVNQYTDADELQRLLDHWWQQPNHHMYAVNINFTAKNKTHCDIKTPSVEELCTKVHNATEKSISSDIHRSLPSGTAPGPIASELLTAKSLHAYKTLSMSVDKDFVHPWFNNIHAGTVIEY